MNTAKLIAKNVQLRVQNNLLIKERNKAMKEKERMSDELDILEKNNIFLIEENDVLKGTLRKYQQKKDAFDGKRLKNKLDKEMGKCLKN